MQALSHRGVAREIADKPDRRLHRASKIDAVYVVYNEFKSIIVAGRARRAAAADRARLGRARRSEPRSTTSTSRGREQILAELLPKHIEFQLYRVLLESAAAEQGARMTAMEAATKNASDMIDHLTLTYNRIRQAAITKEIIEIVSGAAAAAAVRQREDDDMADTDGEHMAPSRTSAKSSRSSAPRVDIEFEEGHLPPIYNAVRIVDNGELGKVPIDVVAEVANHIGENQSCAASP